MGLDVSDLGSVDEICDGEDGLGGVVGCDVGGIRCSGDDLRDPSREGIVVLGVGGLGGFGSGVCRNRTVGRFGGCQYASVPVLPCYLEGRRYAGGDEGHVIRGHQECPVSDVHVIQGIPRGERPLVICTDLHVASGEVHLDVSDLLSVDQIGDGVLYRSLVVGCDVGGIRCSGDGLGAPSCKCELVLGVGMPRRSSGVGRNLALFYCGGR